MPAWQIFFFTEHFHHYLTDTHGKTEQTLKQCIQVSNAGTERQGRALVKANVNSAGTETISWQGKIQKQNNT